MGTGQGEEAGEAQQSLQSCSITMRSTHHKGYPPAHPPPTCTWYQPSSVGPASTLASPLAAPSRVSQRDWRRLSVSSRYTAPLNSTEPLIQASSTLRGEGQGMRRIMLTSGLPQQEPVPSRLAAPPPPPAIFARCTVYQRLSRVFDLNWRATRSCSHKDGPPRLGRLSTGGAGRRQQPMRILSGAVALGREQPDCLRGNSACPLGVAPKWPAEPSRYNQ